MKRIILIALIVLACIPCAAQINVTSEEHSVVEVCKFYRDLSDMWHSATFILYDGENIYLSLDTSNRYDKRMAFRLGSNRDEAITSLGDLKQLCGQKIGTRIEVERWPGHACNIVVADKNLKTVAKNGKPVSGTKLLITAGGFAGYVAIGKKDFDRLIGYLTKYEGEL